MTNWRVFSFKYHHNSVFANYLFQKLLEQNFEPQNLIFFILQQITSFKSPIEILKSWTYTKLFWKPHTKWKNLYPHLTLLSVHINTLGIAISKQTSHITSNHLPQHLFQNQDPLLKSKVSSVQTSL